MILLTSIDGFLRQNSVAACFFPQNRMNSIIFLFDRLIWTLKRFSDLHISTLSEWMKLWMFLSMPLFRQYKSMCNAVRWCVTEQWRDLFVRVCVCVCVWVCVYADQLWQLPFGIVCWVRLNHWARIRFTCNESLESFNALLKQKFKRQNGEKRTRNWNQINKQQSHEIR